MSAAARIDELKKRYEENPRRFFAPLANEYRKAGDLDAAIALCQEHLAGQPGNMNGYVVYGQALFEAARFDEAQATFETALSLDPENLIALRHLGDMARASGDQLRARDWYARVLDADPRNEEILSFLREIDESLAAGVSNAPAAMREAPEAAPITLMDAMPAPEPNLVREALGEAKTLEMQPVAPRSPTSATPVVPFREPVPPPRQSTGLMDLSIDLGAPVEGDFGAELAASLPPSAPLHGAPAVPPVAPRPPKDPINEAFAESFGVLYDETPAEPAKPVPAPNAEFSVEAAPDFSFETTSISFDELAPGSDEVESPFADIAVESSMELTTDIFGEPASESASEPASESASEPASELASEPAPAPADTVADYLFGDAVTEVSPVSVEHRVEHPGASRVPSGGTPPAGAGRVDAIVETPQAFVTETMAELYLQQGFRDEALSVYRQLSAQNPDDQNLRERVRHLEHGDRASLSLDAAVEEASTTAEEPAGAPEGFAPIGAMLEPATPAAGTPAIGRPVVGTPARGTPAVGTPAAGMPLATARTFFAALSLRRALRSDGTPPIGIDAVIEEPAPAPAAAHAFVTGGTLDSLFGDPISEADEKLAVSIASMAEAIEVPLPIVKGQPTKPAETEFSLDNVFRESTPRSGAVVSRRSQKLRFDQFFTPADDAGAVEAPPPAGDPGSPADLEQFSSWLQGLKPK